MENLKNQTLKNDILKIRVETISTAEGAGGCRIGVKKTRMDHPDIREAIDLTRARFEEDWGPFNLYKTDLSLIDLNASLQQKNWELYENDKSGSLCFKKVVTTTVDQEVRGSADAGQTDNSLADKSTVNEDLVNESLVNKASASASEGPSNKSAEDDGATKDLANECPVNKGPVDKDAVDDHPSKKDIANEGPANEDRENRTSSNKVSANKDLANENPVNEDPVGKENVEVSNLSIKVELSGMNENQKYLFTFQIQEIED